MIKKVLFLVAFGIGVFAGSYYWGYLRGKQEISIETYDRLLVELSSDLLVRDALEVSEIEQIRPLLISKLETDFASMIQLYGEYPFDASEHVRCAISRRIRKLKQDGQIMIDEKMLKEAGYPTDIVNDYLDKECLGEPSHTNWSQIEQKSE